MTKGVKAMKMQVGQKRGQQGRGWTTKYYQNGNMIYYSKTKCKEMEVSFVTIDFCNILPLFAIKISSAVFCKR